MTNGLQSQIYEFGEFRIDAAKRLLLRRNGEIIPLTPKIFDTLLYLARNNGKVIEKDELMREIWMDTIVEENNLNKNISVLRRVLGEKPGEHRFIVTVPGQGYEFVAEVRPLVDGGFAIADIKPEETVSENESDKTANQIAKDEAQRTEDKNSIRNRKWLAAFAVLSVFALGATGFYLWRGNETSVDAPIKTVAVLPFKPLVVENRNEALEFGMADTLISKLSGGNEVIVRPLSAIRRYNSLEQDSRAAGRELGVESILEAV